MQARKTRLYFKLQRAAHRLQKLADRELAAKVRMTTQQAAVLSVINNGEGNSQKEIAVALGLNESAVTPMVNRLTGYGYIEKHRSEDDRRAYVLSLTPTGKRALGDTRTAFASVNRTLSSVLSETEIQQLADMLTRLDEELAEPLSAKQKG